MSRIRVLDPHIVNQIAAGEVVERPASVVKELVENALDADARRIDVTVREGGKDLIEVADDGCGMGADDLAQVFLPHATSKITAVGDLQHVGTLGFRGEALASIGSVSRASIVSRAPDVDAGHRVENVEGRVGDVEPAAASPGTVVRVEHLFARVPARRKFLRTAATEVGHIRSLMGRFALAFPHVAFSLRQGAHVMLETAPDEDRRRRIERVHGAELARALLEVRAADGEPRVEAWLGPPSVTRADARLEQTFLNGRSIRDKTVSHAVREAYRDLLPPGRRRPVVFLFLSLDPERVDVNVHPGKAEVRWRDPGGVHRVVRGTLRRRLEAASPGVEVSLPSSTDVQAASRAAAVEEAFIEGRGRSGASSGERSFAFGGSTAPATAVRERTVTAGARAAAEAVGGLRPLAQALGTYLVLEAEDAIVLVDQHALHERILFDQINERLRQRGALEVQSLLVPAVVHLEAAEAAHLLEQQDLLRTLGWVVEPFGDDAVAVRGLPAVLKRPDPEAALQDLILLLKQGRRDGLDRTHLVSEAVDRLACRAAVMAGDTLHEDEVLALLEQAEALNHSHSCPHGRPTRLVMSRADLERWFHRTG